jgi:hypothetical protein
MTKEAVVPADHTTKENLMHDRERQPRPEHRAASTVLALGLSAALLAGACTSGPGPTGGGGRSGTIVQPVVKDLPVAPTSERVDLALPVFSNPTDVTNPLFPIARQHSVVQLGRVDGKPFRTEVTLLPETRIIEWNGKPVETLVSQYVAFLDGRLHEVAYDFYAQDDSGAVWYFGEDVFNFRNGAIADTHGTWIAGKDGPAAMIMPADPKVGDVYRPENIPGFVFEEVTVKSVDETLRGPLGPIRGGLVVEELHMDGQTEDKTFAPGYGEFLTAGGGDVEAFALGVPTDALSEPPPAELVTLQTGAAAVFDAAGSKDWRTASATVAKMTSAWRTHRTTDVPTMIEARMSGALRTLALGVDARDTTRTRQAAIDVAQPSLDLQLRHRPVAEIDLARFDLWAAQLLVDAAEGDAAAVSGDLFTMDYIRDRIAHSLGASDVTRVNTRLEQLQAAVGERDLKASAGAARGLRNVLAQLGVG